MTEISLIDKKDLREQMAGRVEVLDKVKELFLMPELDMLTIQQAADYFEVDSETIQKCYRRNKTEIDSDGVVKETIAGLAERFGQKVQIVKTQYYQDFKLSDSVSLRVPNVGIRMFSKRAILRIGMLLRDSKIAQEVRTQLLNTFEQTTDEQKTKDINDEEKLIYDIGLAVAGGNAIEVAQAATNYIAFKDRHISQLKQDNKMMAAEILAWEDRSSVNKAMRIIATKLGVPFGYPWKWLYDELRYKYGMGLSQRGKAPAIQWVKENEWPNVQQSLSAICEDRGLSPSKIMRESKMTDKKNESSAS